MFVCFAHLQYTFEMIFRSQQFALLDNCCREFLFLQDFFIVTGQHAQDLFNAVLGKTLAMFLVRVTSQLHYVTHNTSRDVVVVVVCRS